MVYKPKNILVTGGAGFIASHFVRYYQTHYPEIFIVNLDKLTYAGSLDYLKNLIFPAQHHFVQGDILDNHLVMSLLNDFK
ncbi:MAG: GDP-mannose 4,6-dehydratase, partial [Candidatus Rickettsiella isopodorum]